MAYPSNKRFDSMLITNSETPLVTKTRIGDHYKPVHNVIEQEIEEHMYITIHSNNNESRFIGKSGDTISVYIITMISIDEVPSVKLSWGQNIMGPASIDVTSTSGLIEKNNGIWIAEFLLPEITSDFNNSILNIHVSYEKNGREISIPYFPKENNKIQLIAN